MAPADPGRADEPPRPARRPARVEPPRHQGNQRHAGHGPRRHAEAPDLRRVAAGSDRPRDGQGRDALRPQHAERHRSRDPSGADGAQPPRGLPAPPPPRLLQAGGDAQRARRLLDPVREPRLVRSRREHARQVHRRAASRRRRLARRQPDEGEGHEPRPDPHQQERPAADLRQHRHPLVGRLPDLRLRRGPQPRAPQRRRREARRRRRHAPQRDEGRARRRRSDRVLRQLLGRAIAAAHALRQGAQLDLRPPEGLLPDLGRRAALPHRPPRQLGADGEDPHRRVDAGDPRQPGARAGDERQLVRRPAAAGCARSSATSAPR